MRRGYASFPDDVRAIWRDIIQRYHFTVLEEDDEGVVLENAHTEIVLTMLDDTLNASLKAGDHYINVKEWVFMADKAAYANWDRQMQQAVQGLPREAFFQAYLRQLKALTEKYFSALMEQGIIPQHESYERMVRDRKKAEDNHSRAWKALQSLDLQHPIRQKYLHDDPSWVDDMIRLMDGN